MARDEETKEKTQNDDVKTTQTEPRQEKITTAGNRSDKENHQQNDKEDVEKNNETYESLKKAYDELKDLLLRRQAEFENYQKRIAKEQEQQKLLATEALIKDLLPLLDNFQFALQAMDSNDPLTKGIELIFSQFFDILEKYGLAKISALDQPYDPQYHEVLLTGHSDKPEGTIIEVLQDGYILGKKVLRPAKVKVSKGPKRKKEEEKH